ncbi:TIGR04219 family outer membrane beta-barrel protein [Candidatus Sulfurimonas marisnigri]|uniref:TIGR04219 family outer membrane beta-barrel protein n=1 Tax=Candidatus Sulfurimonas marisnigri TaxID=2740405 RepID=A0A7S7M0C2_9BACT|nr:TIGR04219 family outer membrane beta-barrel protein [Candidatus Sulfurimonas marisnigri]QOY54760.1 TIGR04219 family outer membrane beta-barrel protein [Candidatus Sulfurimonas marisnigri]
MKKILTALTCAAIVTTTAMADITRVELGAGAWMQTPEGTATYTDGGADGSYLSSKNDNTESYVWALIKHPIPVLPNLRLEYTSLTDEGVVSGKFKDFDVAIGSTTMSYDMKQYDIIPYYNILDNTAWITLDLGLDIKVIDISYDVTPIAGITGDLIGSETIAIPLLYARARVEIPATDIGIEADVKYISFDSNTMYDVRVKADYTLDFVPIIQPALEVGYRVQKIETDDSVDSNLNIEFSGVYAGLIFRF